MTRISDVAKEETVRQVVILVFGTLAVVSAIAIERNMHQPDFWRTAKMGGLLWLKRFCQNEADRWQMWADNAATSYNLEKL